MKRLICLRHAKSSWAEPGKPDRDRPLNDRGEKAARVMGDYIRQHGLMPDLILSSSALRTRQTVEGLLEGSDTAPRTEFSGRLYLAEPKRIFAEIAGTDDAVGSLMVVGHNPGLQEAVVQLIGDDAVGARRDIALKLPTGALAVFDLDIDHWRDLRSGKLIDYQTPKGLS